jgi:hypothetical protein
LEKEYFKNKVPEKLYKELNKDRKLNRYFSAQAVGKCVKIYDDYYHLVTGDISKEGWKKYYYDQVDREALINAAQFIKLKYQTDWKEAAEYVFYRTVGQTWNGMQEEINIIQQLDKYFPLIDFEKAPYELDSEYFTDWQAFSGEYLLFGIQIKPHTYKLMSSAYQVKARENHTAQKERYKEIYKVGHFMVYYKDHKIEDKQDLLNRIDTYLAYNIIIK